MCQLIRLNLIFRLLVFSCYVFTSIGRLHKLWKKGEQIFSLLSLPKHAMNDNDRTMVHLTLCFLICSMCIKKHILHGFTKTTNEYTDSYIILEIPASRLAVGHKFYYVSTTWRQSHLKSITSAKLDFGTNLASIIAKLTILPKHDFVLLHAMSDADVASALQSLAKFA